MKITTPHSIIKFILKDTSFFYVLLYHGVCSNNYFEYDTFNKSFIFRILLEFLALAIIYTNGK